jgi:hypothetical protein
MGDEKTLGELETAFREDQQPDVEPTNSREAARSCHVARIWIMNMESLESLQIGPYLVLGPSSHWVEYAKDAYYCSDCERRVKIGAFRKWAGGQIEKGFVPVIVRRHDRIFHLVAWCDCLLCAVLPNRADPSDEALQKQILIKANAASFTRIFNAIVRSKMGQN